MATKNRWGLWKGNKLNIKYWLYWSQCIAIYLLFFQGLEELNFTLRKLSIVYLTPYLIVYNLSSRFLRNFIQSFLSLSKRVIDSYSKNYFMENISSLSKCSLDEQPVVMNIFNLHTVYISVFVFVFVFFVSQTQDVDFAKDFSS